MQQYNKNIIQLEIKNIAYSEALQYRQDLLHNTTKEHTSRTAFAQ